MENGIVNLNEVILLLVIIIIIIASILVRLFNTPIDSMSQLVKGATIPDCADDFMELTVLGVAFDYHHIIQKDKRFLGKIIRVIINKNARICFYQLKDNSKIKILESFGNDKARSINKHKGDI